jgi:peroxiredoxin
MALTYTPAGELGSTCPDFKLPSVDGKTFARKDFAASKALVVMFICNHCPYVKAIEDRILGLVHELTPQGAAFVGICSNDPSDHPDDSPQALLARWKEKSYGFPYLIDETQDVARSFGAVCTPDIYVFDSSHKLRYRGRLDDSWRNPTAVQREELKMAVTSILKNVPIEGPQNPSMGCSIKWKKMD